MAATACAMAPKCSYRMPRPPKSRRPVRRPRPNARLSRGFPMAASARVASTGLPAALDHPAAAAADLPAVADGRARGLAYESVTHFRPAAGGDHAADDRDPGRRHARLHRAALGRVAGSLLSDHPGPDLLSRREPRG